MDSRLRRVFFQYSSKIILIKQISVLIQQKHEYIYCQKQSGKKLDVLYTKFNTTSICTDTKIFIMIRPPEPLIPTSFNVLQRIPGNGMGDETNNGRSRILDNFLKGQPILLLLFFMCALSSQLYRLARKHLPVAQDIS